MTRTGFESPGPCYTPVDDLPHAAGEPAAQGVSRARPEDFRVDEVLGFTPDGRGQHVLLRIRKRGVNTDGLARRVARLAEVRPTAVGYAGRKDRNAETTQWFSVDLAGREAPDWRALEDDGSVRVLEAVPHGRKLRRGALTGNRFRLRLRELEGDLEDLASRLARVRREGVPNYFGAQRFGRDGANVERARALLAGDLRVRDRQLRGLYLSAARSALFNAVLALRVAEGSWNRALAGEVLMLEGSHSIFAPETLDQAILERLAQGDLHPTGPLWGRGRSPVRGAALDREVRGLAPCEAWRQGLEAAGLRHERRALRLPVGALRWEFDAARELLLEFFLPAGGYATSVVRELSRTRPAPDGGAG